MNLLAAILESKKREIRELEKFPPGQVAVSGSRRSLLQAVLGARGPAIIAEFKRRSPSAGMIARGRELEELIPAFVAGGAVGLSILTDERFFGGQITDLTRTRQISTLPILRKDFILDETQLEQAALAGADAVLLIVRLLPAVRLRELRRCARALGLEVLVEVHAEEECAAAIAVAPEIIGVNNRNLDTLEVSIDTSRRLRTLCAEHPCVISESGITDGAVIAELQLLGYRGFLVGHHLLGASVASAALRGLTLEVSGSAHG